ncbi:MAG: ArsR/SmtB family transcription factor [Promethearchaeota archaeon]
MNKINRKRSAEIITSLESCIDMKEVDVKSYFQDLQNFGKNIETYDNFNKLSEFCYAIGNKERLKIITILKDNDHCVCELEAILDKSQPSISHHLRILESIGLIRSFKKGKFTHYKLVKEKLSEYLVLFSEVFELSLLEESYSILKQGIEPNLLSNGT